MRPALRLLLRALGAGVLGAAALAVSAIAHFGLPLTHRVMSVSLADFVSEEIRGTLVIGSLARFSLDGIDARDVVLFDGDGRRIAKAKSLLLVPDLAAAWQGRIRFSKGLLQHAHVTLVDEGDGLPSLLTTFDAQTPDPTSIGEPVLILVDGIELSNVILDGDLLGLSGLRAVNLQARGKLEIGGAVHVNIAQARALLVEPFGFPAHIDELKGTISTVPTEGVDLTAVAHRGSERARARIRYASPEPTAPGRLRIEVNGDQLSISTLHGLGFDFIPELALPVSGRFTIAGPPDELVMDADLSTTAGDATLEGTISELRGTSVKIVTQSMRLRELLPAYPKVTARGTVRIDAAPDGTAPRVHLEVEPLLYEQVAIPSFDLDGTLTDDGLRVTGLRARSPGTTITGEGHFDADGAIDFHARVSIADIERDENLKRLVPNARGRLEADLHVASARLGVAHLSFRGRIVLSNVRYGVLSASRLEVQGSARGDPEHPRLAVSVQGQEVRIGDYLLGDPTLALRGGPKEYAAEGQFAQAGRQVFHLSAKITAEPNAFVVDADPIEFAVGEGSWRGAISGLRIVGDERIELTLLRLANRSQRLEAKGILRFAGEDQLDAQLQDFDLRAVNALLGDTLFVTEGRADATVELRGDLRDPELHLQGALREGVAFGVRDVGALYFVDYQRGQLEGDGEVDLGARGLLRVRGAARIDRNLADPARALKYGTYDLELEGQGVLLELVPQLADAGVRGAAGGNLRFRGTLKDPDFSGAIQLSELTVSGCSPLDITAAGGYGAGKLDVRVAAGDAKGPLGNANGSMQLDWGALSSEPAVFVRTLMRGPWQLSGETSRRRLDTLPEPLASKLPYPIVLATHFELDKREGVSGGRVRFEAAWDQKVDAGGCGAGLDPRVTGELTLEQGNSRVDTVLTSGKDQLATFQIALDTPVDRWAERGRIDAPAFFRASGRVNIASIERLPYLCEYGGGSLDAELELDGGLSADPILVMTVDSKLFPKGVHREGRRAINVRSCKDDPIRLHLEATAERDELSGSGRMEGCHGGPTTLEGELPVEWKSLVIWPALQPKGNVHAHLRFEGAQLKPLLDRIRGVTNSDAIARGELAMEGPLERMRTTGQVGVEGGRLYLIAMGQELTDIDTALNFHGDWVKLEGFNAKLGKGRIEALGGIALEGLWPARARIGLRANKLPIQREGTDTAWLTGSGALDAEIAREKTRIALKLHRLHVRLPDTDNRTLQTLERHPDVVIVTETVQANPDPYPIEVVIDARRNVTVERNDFDARIATELAVSYRDPEVRVAGYVQFREGEFETFGKRFEISSGGLRFDGASELNPEVFLVAVQKPEAAGTSPVTVSVTGTLEKPIVTFSSEVCPGEVGAIKYMISGECAADDPDLAQESENAQNAFASGMVAGVLTLGAQDPLGALMPRVGYERSEQGTERVVAGFSSEELVPKFMRGLVQRVYVQGGRSTQTEEAPVQSDQAAAADSSSVALDFLIELYFPHNIVGSGRFAQDTWGLDVTWEP